MFEQAALQSDTLSVAAYAATLGRALRGVGGAVIEGEIQQLQSRPNGMLFFSLTDGEATLSCKVFGRDAAQLSHRPADGDLVRVVVDRPDFWVARGSVSLIVSAIELAGEGELLRRRAALLEQLRREGLCDVGRRRTLPRFPRAVGVIAGRNSDGMSDVIRALTDRWPAVHIVTCPSLVQGRAAPRELIDALALLQEHPLVDVIVVARGGGSVQDLACFDDEGLCRALFACAKPVVCAIGHTDNNPVCNHVAWAAFTPSRSAELVVPSTVELRGRVESFGGVVARVPDRVARDGERVAALGRAVDCGRALETRALRIANAGAAVRAAPRRARSSLTAVQETVAARRLALGQGARRQLADRARDVGHAAALVSAFDFRRRGWLLASGVDGGEPVRAVADLTVGVPISLHLRDGRVRAVVERIDSTDFERSHVESRH